MADDEWYYERRRIPFTKGWGPCKKTHWVPVNEYYTGRNPRRVRSFLRTVGIDPQAQFERHRMPVVYLDDIERVPWRYAGFRERTPGDPNWRYYPEDGWNGVPPWQPPIPWEALDPVIADDLRQLEEQRAQQHRENIDQINAEIAAIDGRYQEHIDRYEENMRGGVVDPGGRLRGLRREISLLNNWEERRREEDNRRDARERRHALEDDIRRQMEQERRERRRHHRRCDRW